MQPPHRIVVLGSNSFSGASFTAAALAAGAEVVGISRSEPPDPALLPYTWADHARFRFERLDLNEDLDRIAAVITGYRPHAIVNFAAQSMVAPSWNQPLHWYRTNVVALVGLVERLRHLEGLRGFVQVSTPEVYGDTAGTIDETAPLRPSTPYAVSKAAADMHLLACRRAWGFPALFTRAANVCGPGQPLYRILPRTIVSILTGRRLRLEGGGRSVRSFVDARDVAAATLALARRGAPGGVYHLGTGLAESIRELVARVCTRLNARFEDVVEEAPGRLAQDPAYLLDCARARADLGWSPRPLAETIDDTIAWLEARRDRLATLPLDYVHKP